MLRPVATSTVPNSAPAIAPTRPQPTTQPTPVDRIDSLPTEDPSTALTAPVCLPLEMTTVPLSLELTFTTAVRLDSWPFSRGFSPAGYPAEPLVSHQINRQLSKTNLSPLVIRAFGAHCQLQT
jgi:hypothetical protein